MHKYRAALAASNPTLSYRGLGTLRVASGEAALGVGMFFCVLNGMATGTLSTARCCRFATDPVRRLLQIVYLIKTTRYLAS